jgi:hypothetical protein
MSVPPPGRLVMVFEAERLDPDGTGRYRHHVMRGSSLMGPTIDRM